MSLAYTDDGGNIVLVMDFRTAASVCSTLDNLAGDFMRAARTPNEREIGQRIGEVSQVLDDEFAERRVRCAATGTENPS